MVPPLVASNCPSSWPRPDYIMAAGRNRTGSKPMAKDGNASISISVSMRSASSTCAFKRRLACSRGNRSRGEAVPALNGWRQSGMGKQKQTFRCDLGGGRCRAANRESAGTAQGRCTAMGAGLLGASAARCKCCRRFRFGRICQGYGKSEVVHTAYPTGPGPNYLTTASSMRIRPTTAPTAPTTQSVCRWIA
jgi:hypothetical protein